MNLHPKFRNYDVRYSANPDNVFHDLYQQKVNRNFLLCLYFISVITGSVMLTPIVFLQTMMMFAAALAAVLLFLWSCVALLDVAYDTIEWLKGK